LRTAIYNEEEWNCLEFDRYFDVIRQGRGVEVFGSRGFVAGKK